MVSRQRMMMIWMVAFSAMLQVACSGSGEGVDAGSEVDGSTDGEAVLTRELVEGTVGFCQTHGPIDDSCQEAADCRGYRVPVPMDCSGEVYKVTSQFDCAFANAENFLFPSECTADAACVDAPRACRDGQCVLDVEVQECMQDGDCEIRDFGCACMALATEATEYSPMFGMDCAGLVACDAGVITRCIAGSCFLAGGFMDQAIEDYCEFLMDCDSGFENAEACVDFMKGDQYRESAIFFPPIEAVEMAETCLGFVFGPGLEALHCSIYQ